MLTWMDSVAAIPELNAAQKRAIRAYGARTIGDLLRVLPRRYDDYSRCTPIARARMGEPVTLRVTVEEIKKMPGFRRRITMIRGKVKDASGTLNVIWFNQPWLLEHLIPGREIFLSGTINFRPRFGKQMSNPIWEDASDPLIAGSVAPVYPLTGSVAQKTMRELMASVIDQVEEVSDPIPSTIIASVSLPGRVQAYRWTHRPKTLAEAEEGRRRLAFDEFFAYRLALGSAKEEAKSAGAPRIPFDEAFARTFVSKLPFALTDDQKRAAWASFQDMDRDVPMARAVATAVPMRRLIQGDVGSGKTVVGAFVMAMTYRSGHSAVMMAPTEVLAKQHAVTIRRFLASGDPVAIMLLTSSEKKIWEGGEEKKLSPVDARERLLAGRVVVIGTHALLVRDMLPPDTALAIVDEQHRFGVSQREALSVAKRPDGLVPHLLSMTATPIPRSLALTLYGDLDMSLIRMKPNGRRPIATRVLVGEEREICYEAIKAEVKKGHRVFIVCPLIDESDVLGVKSVTEEAKRLASGPLQGLRLGVLHGKMSPKDKDGVMGEFSEGLLDVLISTTVIEVGVDVPEATIMAIEAAERFGLAQLHQLRGRVGRSERPSSCYLLTDTDGPSFDRLRVLEQTDDGFVIAEEDLKRRGEGNLLGMQQSGAALFKSGRATDTDLMIAAREAANTLFAQDADLADYPELRAIAQEIRETSHQE